VSEEKVGRPKSAQAVWGEYLPDWHPWEDYRQSYSARQDLGGGVLLTLSHPFDYLRWIFGGVSNLAAEIAYAPELGIEAESIADVLIQFDNDVRANVHLDYIRRPPEHSLVVVGTAGTMWSQDSKSWQSVGPEQGFERNDMFLAEMRHFLEVARGIEDPICTLDDGVAALQMALGVKSEVNTLKEISEAR
jgi:predicted dehydrogenase